MVYWKLFDIVVCLLEIYPRTSRGGGRGSNGRHQGGEGGQMDALPRFFQPKNWSFEAMKMKLLLLVLQSWLHLLTLIEWRRHFQFIQNQLLCNLKFEKEIRNFFHKIYFNVFFSTQFLTTFLFEAVKTCFLLISRQFAVILLKITFLKNPSRRPICCCHSKSS